MNNININHRGTMYIIEKEPFESIQDTYSRGWFIIKNYEKYTNYNELVSRSIIHNNIEKEMKYNFI